VVCEHFSKYVSGNKKVGNRWYMGFNFSHKEYNGYKQLIDANGKIIIGRHNIKYYVCLFDK